MRCIEIIDMTATGAVLYKININMRCIEMGSSVLLNMCLCQININMRCIEITISKPFTLIV